MAAPSFHFDGGSAAFLSGKKEPSRKKGGKKTRSTVPVHEYPSTEPPAEYQGAADAPHTRATPEVVSSTLSPAAHAGKLSAELQILYDAVYAATLRNCAVPLIAERAASAAVQAAQDVKHAASSHAVGSKWDTHFARAPPSTSTPNASLHLPFGEFISRSQERPHDVKTPPTVDARKHQSPASAVPVPPQVPSVAPAVGNTDTAARLMAKVAESGLNFSSGHQQKSKKGKVATSAAVVVEPTPPAAVGSSPFDTLAGELQRAMPPLPHHQNIAPSASPATAVSAAKISPAFSSSTERGSVPIIAVTEALRDNAGSVFSSAFKAGIQQQAAVGATLSSNGALATKLAAAAKELYKDGQYAGAIAKYSEALVHTPDDAGILCNRAAASMMVHCYHDAVSDCDAALSLKPAFSIAALRRARALLALGEVSNAMSGLTGFTSASADAGDDLLVLQNTLSKFVCMENEAALALTSSGGGALCLHLLGQAARLYPQCGCSLRSADLEVQAYMQAGEWSNAVTACIKTLPAQLCGANDLRTARNVACAENSSLALALGRAHWLLEDIDAAIRVFDTACRVLPRSPGLLALRNSVVKCDELRRQGNDAYGAGQYKKAISLYDAAIKVGGSCACRCLIRDLSGE
jgi:tetratricopeptide (TPR) repeat protein